MQQANSLSLSLSLALSLSLSLSLSQGFNILLTGSYERNIDRGWQGKENGSNESIFCGNWLFKKPFTVNLRKTTHRYWGFWYKMGPDGTSDLERSIKTVHERSCREGFLLNLLQLMAIRNKLYCGVVYRSTLSVILITASPTILLALSYVTVFYNQ